MYVVHAVYMYISISTFVHYRNYLSVIVTILYSISCFYQLELQRQQLLSERQQFQRDQLKAAEMRALQSPTLQPQTPLLFPPQKVTPATMIQHSSIPPPPLPTTTTQTKLLEDDTTPSLNNEPSNIDEIPATDKTIDPVLPSSSDDTQGEEMMDTEQNNTIIQQEQSDASETISLDPINGGNEITELEKPNDVKSNEEEKKMEDTANESVSQDASENTLAIVADDQSTSILSPQEEDGCGQLESTESMEIGTKDGHNESIHNQ